MKHSNDKLPVFEAKTVPVSHYLIILGKQHFRLIFKLPENYFWFVSQISSSFAYNFVIKGKST
jgi:hypothetical protein